MRRRRLSPYPPHQNHFIWFGMAVQPTIDKGSRVSCDVSIPNRVLNWNGRVGKPQLGRHAYSGLCGVSRLVFYSGGWGYGDASECVLGSQGGTAGISTIAVGVGEGHFSIGGVPYHLRCKATLVNATLVPGGDQEGSDSGSNISVWMDCVDDSQPMRVWKNAILASNKVTRIHLVHDNSHHDNNDMMMMGMDNDSDDDPEFRGRGVSMSSPLTTLSPLPRPSPPPTDHYLLGVFDEAPASAAPLFCHSSQPRGGVGVYFILAIGV
eukprot:scaffold41913_cov54-Attheya_sp.AAC.3